MKINAEKSANAKEVDIKVKTLRMASIRPPLEQRRNSLRSINTNAVQLHKHYFA